MKYIGLRNLSAQAVRRFWFQSVRPRPRTRGIEDHQSHLVSSVGQHGSLVRTDGGGKHRCGGRQTVSERSRCNFSEFDERPNTSGVVTSELSRRTVSCRGRLTSARNGDGFEYLGRTVARLKDREMQAACLFAARYQFARRHSSTWTLFMKMSELTLLSLDFHPARSKHAKHLSNLIRFAAGFDEHAVHRSCTLFSGNPDVSDRAVLRSND